MQPSNLQTTINVTHNPTFGVGQRQALRLFRKVHYHLCIWTCGWDSTEYHCTSCGLSPKAETQRDLRVSQVRLWLDNLPDSPSSFHRCCLTGKVVLSDGTRSGSASDPVKRKAPQWLCMRFFVLGVCLFICLFIHRVIHSFTYCVSTFTSCNRDVWFLGRTGRAGKLGSRKLTSPHYQISRNRSKYVEEFSLLLPTKINFTAVF